MPEPRRSNTQLKDDYRFVFGSETGKRVLDDLIATTGLLQYAQVENMSYPILVGHSEGKRDIGLHIFNMLHDRKERATAIVDQHDPRDI